MKKLMLCSLLFLLMSVLINEVHASDYKTYQEITFEHKGAKLLSEYSTTEMNDYYKRIKGRKFWGWIVFTKYQDEEVSFIDDTMYVIKNEGDTAIEETIKLTRGVSVKQQYSASGSLELTGDGNKDGFKYGLEENLKFDASMTFSNTIEEVYTMKIKVDPGTKLSIMTCGEGHVTNGVAKYFRFWRNVKKGGFEVFVITTEYYYIEKTRL